MTQHQADLQDEINALSEQHAPITQEKLDRHMVKINRMISFYEEKAPQAPEYQGMLFASFVKALQFASAMIVAHQQLTNKLSELAGEEEPNEN